VGESNDSDIAAVLLGFIGLDKTQRDEFMGQLNEFIYVSSRQKRKLVESWLEACRESADPAANMIAESLAEYAARDRKSVKRRSAKQRTTEDDDATSSS